MQKLTYPLTLFTLFLASCFHHKPSMQANVAQSVNDSLQSATANFDETKIESYLVRNITDSSELQLVESTCLVMVQPTEEQIKNDTAEDAADFSIAADDYANYMSQNVLYLKNLKVNTIQAQKRLLKFVVAPGMETVLDVRKTGAPEWNLILFKKGKKPIIVSSLDSPDTTIDNYLARQ